MKSPDFPSVFDWDWSDANRFESARAEALEKRPEHTHILSNICEADSLINFALWSKLPTNHPVGDLWMETQTDLHSSIYLAYGGYFRQALAILRLWFEMAANGVYFAEYYKQSTSRYKQWRSGSRQAPANMRKIAESLSKRSGKLFKADFDTISQKLDPLYANLCHHVHGQGLDVYDLQNGRDNVPRFIEKSFDLWWQNLNHVFGAICYLYHLFYTKEIGIYLVGSESEMRHALSLKDVLGKHIPDFAGLITDAVSLTT